MPTPTPPTELYLTTHQQKRIANGSTVTVLRKGRWYKILVKNKRKVNKIKEQIALLREKLRHEMRAKGLKP